MQQDNTITTYTENFPLNLSFIQIGIELTDFSIYNYLLKT